MLPLVKMKGLQPNLVTFCLFLLFMSFPLISPLQGQIVHGMNEAHNLQWDGHNYIVGTVYWPSGLQVDTRIGIKLSSQSRGDFITTTDPEGKFIFGGLPAGLYSIVIETEKDFEPVSRQVELLESKGIPGALYIKPIYTLMIRLRDREKLSAKPAVVKIENTGVTKTALAFYEKAIELAKTNDHSGAVAQLKLAVEEYPKFMDAYNELGVQYQRLNELEKADQALLAALNIRPDAFEPLLNRGIVLFRMNRLTEAESALLAAQKVKEDSAIAHFYLGRTYAKLQRYDEAEKELTSALDRGGNEMNEAHRMLAMMYIDKDDRSRAITSLETYLRLVPAAPDAEKLRQAVIQLKAAEKQPLNPQNPR